MQGRIYIGSHAAVLHVTATVALPVSVLNVQDQPYITVHMHCHTDRLANQRRNI